MSRGPYRPDIPAPFFLALLKVSVFMSAFGLNQSRSVNLPTSQVYPLVGVSSSTVQSSMPLAFRSGPFIHVNRSYQPLTGVKPHSTYSYVPLNTWYSQVVASGSPIAHYPSNLSGNAGGLRVSRPSLEESYGAPITTPKKKKKLGSS